MLMLTMVSMGAWADVKVVFGEKGTEKFEGKGGTIEMTGQTKPDADDFVTVTFTVSPDEGYIISMPDIEVYETIAPNSTRSDIPQISAQLELDGEEPYNLSAKRDYYVTVKSNLGLWVKAVNFRTKSNNTKRGTNPVYFIANNGGYTSSTGNNYYMVPAADPHQTNYHDAYYSSNYNLANGDPEKPFIATYKTNRDNNSIWEIIPSSDNDGYFFIKHWLTGKYLIYEPPYNDLTNRKSVHLQTTDSPGENAKFDIASNGSIRPISLNSGNRFLNPANNNSDRYYGSGGDRNSAGLVGVWKESTGNSVWHLEETVEPPSFILNTDGTVEISSATGTTVHYLTDGNDPTASSTSYSGAITISSEMTSIKAVAVNGDSKVSNVVTLPLKTYTYYVVNGAGDVAIQHTSLKQAVGKALNSYLDIPDAIRSPYLDGETVLFYTFSEAYSSINQLNDENKITKTPEDDANIYVTYTTDHLSDKFLKLRGARAFNVKVNNEYIYDNSGTLASESAETNKANTNYLWYFTGGDPYAVQVKNADTNKYLVFSTAPTFSLSETPANYILMPGSTSGDGSTYDVVSLREATGNTTDNSAEISVYSINFTSSYYLIDKAGKLIAGPIESTSSELSLPDEWKSPLVSAYHYYTTPNLSGDTYSPTDEITNLVNTGDIYVTYDVSNAIDLTGTKTYLLKFLHGVDFYQESDNDIMTIKKTAVYPYNNGDFYQEKENDIMTTKKTAVYPYNNGDFNLYVNDSEKWIDQLTKGASTRTRWLWHIISNHNGNNLTGDDIDPYHVIFESEQNQKIKVSDDNFINGRAYLRTYKPTDYESVVTGAITKHTQVAATDVPTEYMILGTSISNMTLMTFGKIDNSREKVTSFEMYWKNNPTANYVLEAAGVDQVTGGEDASLTSEQQTTLEAANESENGKKKGQWHTYNSWGYSKPWDKRSDNTTNQQLIYAKHWFETISMGNGEFTVEEVQLTPQVILLDQHGWEIMRTPLYNNYGTESQTLNNLGLGKYNSPMVEKYYWYPTATKKTGYHKYTINGSPVYESSSLSDTPDEGITDFYVTYDVKPLYASSYTGAATADATAATPFLLKQGGSYATTADGTSITAEARPESLEDVTDNMQWYLKPNFDIDREMGYKYAGETGAQDGAKSKAETEADYLANAQNGFDPYNVQIQSKAYPLRYFTTNTTDSKLDGGAWTATTSSSVSLQNMTTSYRQNATGYDQTTLNITNATFMVVADANGNMRLMPRFDHGKVMTSFTSLTAQTAAASAGDEGMGTQSLYTEMMVKPTLIHSSDEILQMNGYYVLASDFTCTASVGTSEAPFKGTIDGQLVAITGTWDKPLFNYVEDATIKNVIIGNTSINITGADTNVGAIVANAKGETRIYNCGILDGNVSGTKYVGGLVGLLDHKGEAKKGSRVINCFSYANVSGGTDVGGIVGYNNFASKFDDIRTMVMNCMFYGDITSGTNISPIYGGNIISNAYIGSSDKGLNNYNYYRYESDYSKNNGITSDKYNCALAAEERYLVRFEFYRLLLNSNRKLAAWYATGSAENANQMAKWVLESADKNKSNPKPYPILKQQGEYYSIINYDDDNITDLTSSLVNGKPAEEDRNKGGKLASLTVNIADNNDTNDKGSRSGSFITTSSKTLPITDKDFDKYNYNYYKVRLPYYNEVGKDNYKDGKVVTGWIITGMTGATQATAGVDVTITDGVVTATPYNFTDRTCTKFDNGDYRVFSQGAYFDVPIGVTAITIKPYWANAAFLSDKYLDKTYNTAFTSPTDVTGGQYTDNTTYTINGISMKVRNSFANALSDITTKGSTVYDNAIVLVGNFHQNSVPSNGTDPFTIMSADFDNDNEPDYSLIYHHTSRQVVSPIRFDFINILGTAMAQKPNGSTLMCNIGIFQPYGWFEVTNTALIHFGQFEYDYKDKKNAPLILLGGEVDQIVSNNSGSGLDYTKHTQYIHVGSNVWFKEFHNGTHLDKTSPTPHRPISVTGGQYEKFYLSGMYRPDATKITDNAECYINGGKFGEVAGAGQEQIQGDVTWIIDYADIDNFYGGGINATNAITGDINVTIKNSHVDVYCGGPKFGNMTGYDTESTTDDKTVTTNADGCVFRRYFGAGYGGASYYRYTHNKNLQKENIEDSQWDTWANTYISDRGKYVSARNGIATGFEYEYFVGSAGTIYGRFYINYASFSKAITNNVYSNLTGCNITGDFYGGGSLGVVNGTAYSTLDGCIVDGSVFGGGYSASVPTVDVVSGGFSTPPTYNSKAGIFTPAVLSASVPYKWTKVLALSSGINISPNPPSTTSTNNTINTDQDLSNLGQVKNVSLTIRGNTYVKGDIHTYDEEGEIETTKTVVGAGGVFGGGDASAVNGSTNVKIEATSTQGVTNVYGGGNKADVNVNTNVEMSGGLVTGNVYGGGNIGDVGTITKNADYNYKWKKTDGSTANTAENNKITGENTNTGICKVTISGGTIGTGVAMSDDGTYANGNVFGAGKGLADTWWCEKAIVFATNVTISAGTVRGTVYGGGEVGRVEDDAKVTIGEGENVPTITGNVFGAGAGIKTHGYSALVRGNSDVTVQGAAQVGGSVYGGGEIASVGRFTVVGGLPKHPDSGGTCKVTIQGNAKIGESGTGHNVFGACKGVTPAFDSSNDFKNNKSMQIEANRPKNADGTVKAENDYWNYVETYDKGYEGTKFVWVYYRTEAEYLAFLKTLALTSHPYVTIGGSANVYGSVYGGGERGVTLGHVNVDITGGTVAQDVYGGGALADTNLGNWDEDGYTVVTGLTEGTSSVKGLYTQSGAGTDESPYVYTEITENTTAGSGTYYSKGAWTHESKSAWYTTHVSLTGGTIVGDAYGGGHGQKEYGTKGQAGYVSPIEAMVYGDVLVELNNNNNGGDADGSKLGCAVTRVFGCNNLNGTPKGKAQVYVYATQKSGESSISDKATKGTNTYDVQAVYGGGNLAKYEPVDATLIYNETNKTTVDAARAEVIIDGCALTSIKQVYGGGNAAPAPATYVEVNRCYEIDEVFGGGNGYDNYSLKEGANTVWYQNPGANVGYYTYATYPKTGNDAGAGTSESPWKAFENPEYSGGSEHKAARLAATAIQYGSGIATLVVKGGTIHTSYGGSNSKGNVRAQLASTYSAMFDDCAMAVAQTYGGGKNAYSDADAEVSADCAKGVEEMFGGSRDADFDGNINLTITNGSSLKRVFGGNNTSGAVNGSITVTIEEGGCEPIHIGSLYAGGFLAPYSVYGYNDDKTAKETGDRLYADPRINVISATRIDNIYGGGYQAKLVGNPHINVNMKKGMVIESYAKNMPEYNEAEKDDAGNMLLPIGTIGNIFGGGNMADVVGNTFVEIGTGTWHNQDGVLETISTDGNTYTYNESTKQWVDKGDENNTSETTPKPARFMATITGNVYGGGNNADVEENTNVIISGQNIGAMTPKGSTTIAGSVYGGGNLGSVGRFDVIGTAKPTSCTTGTGLCTVTIDGYAEIGPDDMQMKTETGYPNDAGHVFGASRGEVKAPTDGSDPGINTEVDYKTFVDKTEVTIGGYAFVKGSVYGGSENGHVLHDTHVVITDKCQIGNGDGVNRRYTDEEWAYDGSSTDKSLAECAHWPYGNKIGTDDNGNDIMEYLPYDIYKDSDSDEIPDYASDGHTFYGNVFGGGSGYYSYGEGAPLSEEKIELGYSKGAWLREAGAVYGNTVVDITGGHILTSVYGGNEQTDVTGTCTINMSDGTVGVPRTVEQMKAHPVTCYVFGAGKGDQRINFNTWTNVASTQVNISGKARIYGSTFGGGEDGHVIGDAVTTISKGDNVTVSGKEVEYPYIGTTGTSAVDGNIFGGGRGFSETALTAGVVGGNTTVNIHGGTMLGTVFGGGRLASVGTNFANAEDTNYGKMQGEASDMNHGVIRINIDGGTIGATGGSQGELAASDFSIGDVFGGCKGSSNNDLRFGLAKHTFVTMTGGKVKGSVYGGGEVAVVEGDATIEISGGEIGDGVTKKGGAKIGNIFGGGKGNTTTADAGLIMGNTKVTINPGSSDEPIIYHNIYGGGAYGSVGTITRAEGGASYVPGKTANVLNMPTAWIRKTGETGSDTGNAEVCVYGGIIGIDGDENGMVFGSSRGDVATPGTDGVDPNDRLAWVYNTKVVIGNSDHAPTIKGSVYGSGENGHVFNDSQVEVHKGTIGVTDDDAFEGPNYRLRGNVYGGGCGEDNYPGTTDFNPLAGIVLGTANVTIDGGQVVHNVYGAGALGSVVGKTTVTIADNAIIGVEDGTGGNVFGAARGKEGITVPGSNLANSPMTEVNINSGQVWNSVYGGGEAGYVKQGVVVNMTGGVVAKDIYGGGALADTNTDNWDAAKNDGAGGWAEGKTSASNTTTINLLGGTIGRNAYGGGLGQVVGDVNGGTSNIEAIVYGDVNLNLNGLEASDYIADVHSSLVTGLDKDANDLFTSYRTNDNQGCVVLGEVFGCNNINGTPKGHAKVHVFKTMPKPGQTADGYDVATVFGGGNKADYVPADTKQATEVIIEGCGLTSIQQVYGGGNAAATPGTLVLVKGAKIIDEVFGGGNGVGSEDPTAADYNPGANVGYKTKLPTETDLTPYASGGGKSLVQLMAGTVHNAYGGSNSNGDIRGGSSVTTVENEWKDGDGTNASCCKDLIVDQMFGGGKNANMKSGANIILGCSNSSTWVKEIYAGAENANVGGNVSLTLTSGKYGRVFGGNKTSGILDGSITVNIEENGQCGIPLIIGELYGGGNKAPYSIYGYNSDRSLKTSGDSPHASPVVNVRAFTSIGNIFGGGYGVQAEMYGSPTVNINETLNHLENASNFSGNAYNGETLNFVDDVLVIGKLPEGATPYTVVLPNHEDGKIGAINNVFGGGNAAKVNGDTHINIGTTTSEPKVKLDNSGNPLYTDEANTIPDKEDFPVVGADIRGNVYGGGNEAEVTGNTNVTIGKQSVTP